MHPFYRQTQRYAFCLLLNLVKNYSFYLFVCPVTDMTPIGVKICMIADIGPGHKIFPPRGTCKEPHIPKF